MVKEIAARFSDEPDEVGMPQQVARYVHTRGRNMVEMLPGKAYIPTWKEAEGPGLVQFQVVYDPEARYTWPLPFYRLRQIVSV